MLISSFASVVCVCLIDMSVCLCMYVRAGDGLEGSDEDGGAALGADMWSSWGALKTITGGGPILIPYVCVLS